MCDVCVDFHDLLLSYEERSSKEQDEVASLNAIDVDTVLHYVNQWVQRQCMCCYRESKNFDRFIRLTQSVVFSTLQQLQEIQQEDNEANNKATEFENAEKTQATSEEQVLDKQKQKEESGKTQEDNGSSTSETSSKSSKCRWSQKEREKLFHLLSKIFLLSFPLYIAMKHSGTLNPLAPVKDEGGYCEPHDPDVPAPLIRAVSVFCHHGGFNLMSSCFDMEEPLPVGLAQYMVAVICNLKLWLNYNSVIQLFVPLRGRVMKYMCRLADKELRTQAVRTMAEFMWNAVKDPIDAVMPTFDRDGLDLAFKYFTSTTLTMRLAGIAQINVHITAFNELCNSETVAEVEQVGHALAAWLTENNIISHIFGPNLHVEVIKQSHIVLSFLAMEGRISSADMDTIWQAAQLKHCARPVYDLLAPLVKHLAPTPVLHLYSLLGKLEPKDHTEQSLFLASALIKFIWTSGAPRYSVGLSIKNRDISRGPEDIESSSSDPSGMDGSSPEEDEEEPSPAPSEGPSPRKQARGDSSDCEGNCKTKSIDRMPVESNLEINEFTAEKIDRDEPLITTSPIDDEGNGQVRLYDSKIKHQSGSDAEADTEKSAAEESVVHEKRKRKVLRKRKTPQKRLAANVEENIQGNVIISEERKDLPNEGQNSVDIEEKSRLETTLLDRSLKQPKIQDTLDSVKQQQRSLLEPNDQQVPTTALLRSTSKDSEKYVSLVEHGSLARDLDSVDDSHDEEDSDNVTTGVVVGAADTTGAVISELAGLVHATGQSFLPSGLDEMLSDEEGSYPSSRISNKSEKNMADFDGEESGCEEELAQLAARHLSTMQMQSYHPHSHHHHPHHHHHHHHHHNHHHHHHHHNNAQNAMTMRRSVFRPPQVRRRAMRQQSMTSRLTSQFNLETVCKPGNTLLWDLLQDDKIGQLSEGLALEAEKALCNLLCFNVDRLIPMKFIEGCLENLAGNRSVVVSLRLLPKLLSSFQQFSAMDAHTITTWADRERGMMKHFFNNLKTYTSNYAANINNGSNTNLYSHQTEVQVRLQFLSSIFSPLGSPDCFRLSLEQVDILWQCLSQDPICADELFSWLLSQAKSTEQHALGMDTLKHLCMKKLPSLPPETISMTGLSLFQQLCNLARLAAAHLDRPLRDVDSVGMDFLWRIALRAKSTDVSMAAIQYLNGYYMSRQLTQEAEFVSQCMTHLAAASSDLENNEEASLRCIQRALLLLRTHLEAFRKRYAYHLRRWALEDRGAGSHVAMSTSEKGQQLKIFVQPAGIPEKTQFTLSSTDYVADLRAEVAKWWDDTQKITTTTESTAGSSGGGNVNSSVLGTLLTDGPIRMITQGQELTFDYDEKTLQEMGFKDGQLVFISLGAAGNRGGNSGRGKRDTDSSASLLPPPPRDSLPTLLLLRPQYFEQLFNLMRTLSAMKATVKAGGQKIPHTKAQVLSRRVWDTLMLLPTSPTLLQGFQKLEEASLPELLDPISPQKLMYSLYIVESLSRRNPSTPPVSSSNKLTITPLHDGDGSEDIQSDNKDQSGQEENIPWSVHFVQNGGLRHLFDIFMSGCLERHDGSEWQQDCLASLLKQLCHLGVIREDKKKPKVEKLIVPRLSDVMLSMMNVDAVMKRITSILNTASMPRDPNHYKTGLFGRSQVIHYTMALLVCWVHSDIRVRQIIFSSSESFGKTWLRRLVLEDPEPAVRREVCTALYRLCLGTTLSQDDDEAKATEKSDTIRLIVSMLNILLQHLVIAEAMQPSHRRRPDIPLHLHSAIHEDGKEPYGPACRDYFWLVCRLVDALPAEAIRESGSDDVDGSEGTIDLESLASRVIDSLLNRETLETRHNTVEDDALVGLLNLTCNIMSHNPPCKQSKVGENLLNRVFDFLFALPNSRMKHVPKCKSQVSRSAAFDLLVELVKSAPDNYRILHEKLLLQHKPGPHSPYPWDYWPHEDGRADCGYVGLTNLGATCYMASCMQHLYMMPQARMAILNADCNRANKHQLTLRELQRMFAYLLESERKAYNPRSFCRVYTMNHEPLNTGEQKDMAEFFIDLVSKLEEMTSDLKTLVKNLFCGVISNNVVSLDCEHVSRTLEEFYTVRCQVADMRNLYESLDEVTVKDTLEGDNMYTCSQCGKKARAEKRACFKKLPRIMCFNTMRYTFNMGTMLKEKVNTHFSFPLRLDMSGYIEKKLIPQHYRENEKTVGESENTECENECDKETFNKDDCDEDDQRTENYQYDLIGVTVHTGTADGGHYYSFIRDRTSANKDKWFLFNDAEVKPFDPSQIAAECFGGEMTSKTYDSVTDKFMDFSFEKTNSAYMLFYELCADTATEHKEEEATVSSPSAVTVHEDTNRFNENKLQLELNKELEDWIWQDNMHFLQDKNIFEHTYFSFMWQICGYIPQTLLSVQPDVTEMSAELSTSFFMETFIHAKEKPTMVQWVELLTKQFNASTGACARFLERMASDSWWPIQILVKCPNQMVRQMFQRLCIHVIQRLRPSQAPLYLLCENEDDGSDSQYVGVGIHSCVTKFVRMLLSLMDHAKQHLKHLTEYFSFLYEFCKMGEEETLFLIRVQAISTMINFYLGHKTHEMVDTVSEEEEEEEEEIVVAVPAEKLRPASLDKMITLIATLVEKSRGPDHRLTLSPADLSAVAGGKGFPFLYQQTRDVINLNQTRNLIQSLCRWNDRLAIHIVTMIFQAITKHTDMCQPFFKLLTLLTEGSGPTGLPSMTQLILNRVWDAARVAPHAALDWLALAVTRSKLAHTWVLQELDIWLQHFLIGHSNQRVRSAAAFVLVSLVPSTHFRQGYRSAHRLGLSCNSTRDFQLSPEATIILHQIYTALLRLLQPARHHIDIQTHGTMKLTAYFALMSYCVVSKTEKLMFGQYLNDLWTLFHPKLSEPSIPVHHNKQAVLLFWHHVCIDCPENVTLILHNPHITKNIAFNYILADHEDQDVVLFNRVMLPAYYGLLRLCCQQSRAFTRQLAAHQNIQWAFKNITPHPTQYSTAVDELFKLMHLLVARHPDQTEQEEAEIASFRRSTLSSYLQGLDGRSCWATLISAFRILIESDDDRLYVVYNGGLATALEAFHMLHIMYHEATACHVANDLAELIAIIVDLVRCMRTAREGPDARSILATCKEWPEILRKLATLLNTYNPPEIRNLAIDLLKELVMLVPAEAILILVPLLSHCHAALQEALAAVPPGPFLPRRSTSSGKISARPARPMIQMAVPHSQLEATKGVDPEYDTALLEFYLPYHELIDVMCRLAINHDCMTDTLVNLSAMLGFEGVPLHLALFPRLWLDVHAASHIDRKHIVALLCSSYTVDYVDAVLLDERSSLGVPAIHAFLKTFFPKLATHVLTQQTCSLIDNLVSTLSAMVDAVDIKSSAHRLTGDLRALALVYSSGSQLEPPKSLHQTLETLLTRTRAIRLKETSQQQQEVEAPAKKRKFTSNSDCEDESSRRIANSPNKNEETLTNHTEHVETNAVMDVEDKTKTEKQEEKSMSSEEERTTSEDNKIQNSKGSGSVDGMSLSPTLMSPSTAGSCNNQLLCSLTNISWLEMLEKTIVNLQVIVSMQTKNN
ncbi:ubiquitin carboxyl-terminal hydrolase puf [Chelonus insularis]|uniref:ubiquitin carboxyl-terminal hydrolase puf n=1 Tax=Chelonus insularis TaxID=460826 RepID=UPI001589FA31|nr:ubiquitin carboxyl-terminal hydrolase puf [Chelonus insularis]